MKSMITLALIFLSQLALADISIQASQDKEVDYHNYNFGRIQVGRRIPIRFRVTNEGESLLTFKKATISGANFSAIHSCKSGLRPKEVCHFSIEYWPLFEGLHFGRFQLSFDQNSDIVVDVQGEATTY